MSRVFLLPAAKGKRVVLWAVACFLASQVMLRIYLDARRADLDDPLYALRLRQLRARLAQSPGAPLVLLLGSSRTKYGVRPAAMPVRGSPPTPPPVIYNFALNGSGAIRQLLYFRRLLADGVRPDWLLVETWPPLWAEDGYFAERKMVLNEDQPHWRDLPLLCRYFPRDLAVLTRALQSNLLPLQADRSRLLLATAGALVPRQQLEALARERGDCVSPDGTGWFPLDWGFTAPEKMRRSLQLGVANLKPLLDPVRIDPRSDAALRELLEECRARCIKVGVVLLPEHSVARGWYTPQARALVRGYLGRLGREWQVPIIDARDWLPDEAFADCAHIGLRGAGPFSERLSREVSQPLLQGGPLGERVLLREGGPTR